MFDPWTLEGAINSLLKGGIQQICIITYSDQKHRGSTICTRIVTHDPPFKQHRCEMCKSQVGIAWNIAPTATKNFTRVSDKGQRCVKKPKFTRKMQLCGKSSLALPIVIAGRALSPSFKYNVQVGRTVRYLHLKNVSRRKVAAGASGPQGVYVPEELAIAITRLSIW